MNYVFPPPVPLSIGVVTLGLYVLIVAFALAAIFRVFAWYEQRSPASRLHRSWIALALAALVCGSGLLYPQTRARLDEYLGFWSILLYSVAVMTLFLQFCKRPCSFVPAPLACCVAALLAIVISPLPPPLRDLGLFAHSKPECHGHLRNLYLTHMNAASARSGRLADAIVDSFPSASAPQSWRLLMLNYMERPIKHGHGVDPMADYDIHQPWDAPVNLVPSRTYKSQYSCPWSPFPIDELGRYYTAYALITGHGTAFPGGHGIKLDTIAEADGLSHTLLLGECSGLNIAWVEPRDIDVSKQKIGINLPGDRPRFSSSILSSYHTGGAYVALADGSVRFLSEKIDPKVLQALTTATGGENVPDDGW